MKPVSQDITIQVSFDMQVAKTPSYTRYLLGPNLSCVHFNLLMHYVWSQSTKCYRQTDMHKCENVPVTLIKLQ